MMSVNTLFVKDRLVVLKCLEFCRLTWRAGVRVPSTSNRQMVFLIGRSSKGGKLAAILAKFDDRRQRERRDSRSVVVICEIQDTSQKDCVCGCRGLVRDPWSSKGGVAAVSQESPTITVRGYDTRQGSPRQ